MNPNYSKMNIEPIENKLRTEIGISLSPHNLSSINEAITQLGRDAGMYKEKLQKLKSELFY